MTVPVLSIRNVSHAFRGVAALDDISLDIAKGSFTVLLGPSGSGKTTLLNILGGFLTPARGSVLIDGEDLTATPPARRPTATVFQDYALFPHMTVGGNVGFGLRMRGVDRSKRDRQAAEMLKVVGLDGAFDRRPHELSGGQRQRVALARSLVVGPKVLLLDEPLGALDLKLRRQMQEELKNIQRRVGTTFVHVTHDQEEAMAIADRVVVMNRGRIEDEGTPERVYLHPRTAFAAGFMGESNMFEGRVTAAADGACEIAAPFGRVTVAGDFRAGDLVLIAIRPEHVLTDGAVGDVDLGMARVEETGFFGTHHQCICRLEAGGALLRVRLPQDVAYAAGERRALSVESRFLRVFRQGGER